MSPDLTRSTHKQLSQSDLFSVNFREGSRSSSCRENHHEYNTRDTAVQVTSQLTRASSTYFYVKVIKIMPAGLIFSPRGLTGAFPSPIMLSHMRGDPPLSSLHITTSIPLTSLPCPPTVLPLHATRPEFH